VFREGINTGLTPLNTLFVDAVDLGEWREFLGEVKDCQASVDKLI